MKLVISIDVEEEGLFFGQYPRTPPGVTGKLFFECDKAAGEQTDRRKIRERRQLNGKIYTR